MRDDIKTQSEETKKTKRKEPKTEQTNFHEIAHVRLNWSENCKGIFRIFVRPDRYRLQMNRYRLRVSRYRSRMDRSVFTSTIKRKTIYRLTKSRKLSRHTTTTTQPASVQPPCRLRGQHQALSEYIHPTSTSSQSIKQLLHQSSQPPETGGRGPTLTLKPDFVFVDGAHRFWRSPKRKTMRKEAPQTTHFTEFVRPS